MTFITQHNKNDDGVFSLDEFMDAMIQGASEAAAAAAEAQYQATVAEARAVPLPEGSTQHENRGHGA